MADLLTIQSVAITPGQGAVAPGLGGTSPSGASAFGQLLMATVGGAKPDAQVMPGSDLLAMLLQRQPELEQSSSAMAEQIFVQPGVVNAGQIGIAKSAATLTPQHILNALALTSEQDGRQKGKGEQLGATAQLPVLAIDDVIAKQGLADKPMTIQELLANRPVVLPEAMTAAAQQLGRGEGKVDGSFDNLLMLQAANNQSSTQSGQATKAMPSLPVQTFVGQQGWGAEVGERIRWMVGQNIQAVQLKLHPANLGSIDVRISMQNDQLTLTFTSNNAAVRDALELALPRLREAMLEDGLNLANVDVFGQSQQDDDAQQPSDADEDLLAAGEDGEDSDLTVVGESYLGSGGIGLIDYYV